MPTANLSCVYFYISGGCNLSCRHCWITPDSAAHDMDTAGVRHALHQCKDAGVSIIKLTGGEPFLRKDIFEIFDCMRDLDLTARVETNGTLITPAFAERLAQYKIQHISISLDSTDAVFHDTFRGKAGAFDAALAGISALQENGFRPEVIASIYSANVDEVEKLAFFLDARSISILKLNPIMAMGRGKPFADCERLLSISEVLALERAIQIELQPKRKIRIMLDIPPAFKPLSSLVSQDTWGTCGIKNIVGILADGTISLCGVGRSVKNLVFGNVLCDSLKNVWEQNETLLFIREHMNERLEGVCGKCILKNICLGKCRAFSYYQTGSLTAPFAFCSQALELGLFPQTRLSLVETHV